MKSTCLYTPKSKPSVFYPVVIVFLEFFAWGLLTTPMLNQLRSTFGEDTLLINGIIQGIKGFLSFLSAPLIGACSDIKGRRSLLLITVIATCMPIPLLIFEPYWFFTLLALSGMFSVTYTIVFAYVSDITTDAERNFAFGLVSATFAASLITSPVIGTLIDTYYSTTAVIILSTLISFIDVLFIIFIVPESLGYKEKYHKIESNNHSYSDEDDETLSTNKPKKLEISWDQVDPFKSFRTISNDKALWMISIAVALSYMPEAGQYSCFMVYLMSSAKFDTKQVSLFLAWVGSLAVLFQVFLLDWLANKWSQRTAILIGLFCQFSQLVTYALATDTYVIWLMGIVLAASSIVYPAMNGWCSLICDQDNHGIIQGIITGVRGLCMGLGPALYGVIFHLFGIDIEMMPTDMNTNIGIGPSVVKPIKGKKNDTHIFPNIINENNQYIPSGGMDIPGPPFLFASILVVLSVMVILVIEPLNRSGRRPGLLASSIKTKYERLQSVDDFETSTVNSQNYEEIYQRKVDSKENT